MIKWRAQKLGIRLHYCECQISTDKQRAGLTIQREGAVTEECEAEGYSVVSVVNWGVGAEERKQQLWAGWDCCREAASHWQTSGNHLTFLTFTFLDPLLQLLHDLHTCPLGQSAQSKGKNWALKGQFSPMTNRHCFNWTACNPLYLSKFWFEMKSNIWCKTATKLGCLTGNQAWDLMEATTLPLPSLFLLRSPTLPFEKGVLKSAFLSLVFCRLCSCW